jgi:hypothetical protein
MRRRLLLGMKQQEVFGDRSRGSRRVFAVVSAAGETGLLRLAGYVSLNHRALVYVRPLAVGLGLSG